MPSKKLTESETLFAVTIREALGRIPFDSIQQPLYHFTDIAGLKGILSTRSLWASLVTALEDETEIEYALSCARRILQNREVSCDSSFQDEIIPFLDPQNSEMVSTLGMKTYVVSFSTSVEGKAHWQSYGRSGKGCALAFGLMPLVIPGIFPIPVLYESIAQDKLLREFIESNAKLFDDISRECPPEESRALRQKAIQWTALGIWILAPALKNPRFNEVNEEKEWRLIVIDPEHVQVAYGKGLSQKVEVRRLHNREIPYKVLQYDTLPIVGLELGAYAPIDENDLCLSKLLLDATGGLEVPITRSQVLVAK